MKKAAKILWIIVGIVFLFAILVISLADKNTKAEETQEETVFPTKEWKVMTYEEKDDFLNKAIKAKTFSNATEVERGVREAIKKEIRNPKTTDFEWSPSIYNGSARVVEADSGWIYIAFKCNAKNDFGVKKEIMGSVTYKYVPETNSLDIYKWDINQNN